MLSISKENKGLKLTWDAVVGAVTYYIFRQEEGQVRSQLYIKTVGLEYYDKTCKAGLDYTYIVQASDDAATPNVTKVGEETATFSQGEVFYDSVPRIWKYQDEKNDFTLKKFLQLVGDKADYFLKQVKLFLINTKFINRCTIANLLLLSRLTEADLSPYGVYDVSPTPIYRGVVGERLRMHMKANVWLLAGRGTRRVIRQIVKLYVDWFAELGDYFTGQGYGYEPYGEVLYGSIGFEGTFTLKILFLYPAITDFDRDKKLARLKLLMPKYVPAWVVTEYGFYQADGTVEMEA